MPFFTKGATAAQLSLLYVIRAANPEITEDKLYACVSTCGVMDWFGFSEALGLILEEGYAAEVPRTFGQSILLTDLGKQALDLFQDTLTASSRRKMDEYLQQHRGEFIRAQQFSTRINDLEDGSACLTLHVSEAGRDLLKIQLALPSHDQALCMQSRWEKAAPDIYDTIYSQLLQKDDKKE